VPHWNNAEGATHDTSRCFIGDIKLRELERVLPAGVAILGIDEHTALSIDFATDVVAVHGKGAVTIRIPGAGETAIHSGATETVSAFTARFPSGDAPQAYEPAASAAPSATAPLLPTAPSPRDLLAPAVERLLTLRATARAEKRYGDADAIRDAITALGVELSDQADGVTWSVRA
jgi:cysteinyl-tRNA synthetase